MVTPKPTLSFQGTTAMCSAICQGDAKTDKITATLTLYQGDTYIDSWSESGVQKVAPYGECKVTHGKTYRLELAYSINGVDKPVISVSNICR